MQKLWDLNKDKTMVLKTGGNDDIYLVKDPYLLEDNDEFKSNKLELEIITINLSNITSPDGTQLHKHIFKTSKVTT